MPSVYIALQSDGSLRYITRKGYVKGYYAQGMQVSMELLTTFVMRSRNHLAQTHTASKHFIL